MMDTSVVAAELTRFRWLIQPLNASTKDTLYGKARVAKPAAYCQAPKGPKTNLGVRITRDSRVIGYKGVCLGKYFTLAWNQH